MSTACIGALLSLRCYLSLKIQGCLLEIKDSGHNNEECLRGYFIDTIIKKIGCLMAHTACLVCLFSAASGCHKNTLGIASTSSWHITKLEQSTFLMYLWAIYSMFQRRKKSFSASTFFLIILFPEPHASVTSCRSR